MIIRNDTHMTSMKILQFSRLPTPLVQLRPKFSTPLTLDVQFQTKPPSPNHNQSIKRKHNPRMSIISYQVFPSGRFSFSVSTH